MKIWHISDTHGLHEQLTTPQNIDVVVHSGDASNTRDPIQNVGQLKKFLIWFADLPIKEKIFTPGNHDVSLWQNYIARDEIESMGIKLLLETGISIQGIHFWGSPWVPRYGDWAWMVDRGTINKKWMVIPDNTDVLITHGPPFGYLDATYNSENDVELVGCRALAKRVLKLAPKAHLFGHVHSVKDIRNGGTRTSTSCQTLFSNGSCCDDGKIGSVTSHGNVIDILTSP